MAKDQTSADVYTVDFYTFHPKPKGTFSYRGTSYPAWSPLQLGQRAFAQIDSVGDTLKSCKTVTEQFDVIVDAIVLLVPTAPAELLRNEPFDALIDAFTSLAAAGQVEKTPRPTKAGRNRSGSRRTTAR